MFLEQQMISEGSCDTEDWSNDALPSPKKELYLTMY